MKKPVFTGAAVAIITPMNADGSVNFEELGRIIDDQIAHGTDAIVICGTTGESPTLSDEEHTACIRYAVKQAAGRVPVIAGTGSNDTKYAIWLSQQAQADGADALLLVTPYYNKTSQAGLVAHYTAIANAVNLPCILYNVPSRTGCNLTPASLAQLAKLPNINAVKEASGNISQVAEIAAACGTELNIYSGNDDQIVPLLALGGKGVISVLSNVAPQYTHDICAKWFAGETQESLQMQLKALPLCKALFADVNPIPGKVGDEPPGLAGRCLPPAFGRAFCCGAGSAGDRHAGFRPAVNHADRPVATCCGPFSERKQKMTDIVIQGIYGRMGRALIEKIAARQDCRVVAGVDREAGKVGDIPVYAGFEGLPKVDAIIDFSSPAGAVAAVQYGAVQGVPCVICSTGLSAEDETVLEDASAKTPIFRSANMSLGVNVLIELARQATRVLSGEFDIEIVEKHHHNKLDAPSGTALMIADAINAEAGNSYEYVYDRSQVRQKRGAKELGISSVRGGGIVGEHDVLFCGPEEVLTLSHSAGSRGVFADGAVQAALYVAGREPGYYTMTDLLRGKLPCV